MRLALSTLALLTLSGLVTGCAGPGASAGSLVILLTDFGEESSYVGQMKGAIYAECPSGRIDEITHEVPPFDVTAGARLLAEAAPLYPPGTIFVAVVDPGVGTERRPLVIRTADGKVLIGPDNGLLMAAAGPPGSFEVRAITYRAPGRESTTFHGRDIFGPTAGRLAAGVNLEAVSTPVDPETVVSYLDDSVTAFFDLEGPNPWSQGSVREVDRYGNVITTIHAAPLLERGLKSGDVLHVTIGAEEIDCPWVTAYGDVPKGETLALKNSRGLVELAKNQESLAEAIGARPGYSVRVTLP